ncbi:hypothetical protein [Streptomyces malaysiensis]|uniref:Uncharacterized protein n=1 Tax=Streptomyces malaysiensis subsp. samsunensis TaxID=459658 RepID=A0A9X2RZI7_STRMQ|nr:hypothetical protein [Streptomyces samsunensis]MCQ8836472.1 hypothetical protein [Streptomyces samsunensis]
MSKALIDEKAVTATQNAFELGREPRSPPRPLHPTTADELMIPVAQIEFVRFDLKHAETEPTT